MEETNFVLLWKEHYEKIDQSLAINKRLLKELLTEKAGSSIRSLIRGKAAGIVAAVVWLVLLSASLAVAIVHYSSAANYFIVSIGAIFLINVKALYDYIRHLLLINSIRYDGSVRDIQHKLRRLRESLIRHSRVMVLQIPFWSTFELSDKWFPGQVGAGYILFQVLLTGSFVWLALWLYKKLSLNDRHNRWVRRFLSGIGGREILNAEKFYRELEELEA
ncbi:MAG TPA: hypothetical protein VFE32_19065 [Puia sp.]|jgi:hypothetical protein|nr:hypothetical protein [Puia sp.]